MAAVALCPTAPAPPVAAAMASSPRLTGMEEQLATVMAMLTGFMAQVQRQHESLLARVNGAESTAGGFDGRLSRLEQELFGKAVESYPEALEATAASDERPVLEGGVEESGVEALPLHSAPALVEAPPAEAPGATDAELPVAEVAAEENGVEVELVHSAPVLEAVPSAEVPAVPDTQRSPPEVAAEERHAQEVPRESDAENAPQGQGHLLVDGEAAEVVAGEAALEQSPVAEDGAASEAAEPPAAAVAAAPEPEPAAPVAAAAAASEPEPAAPAAAASRRRPMPVRPLPEIFEISEDSVSSSSGRHSDWEQDIVLTGGRFGRFRDGKLIVRIAELPLADGVNGSTGHQIWPGSVVLAGELLRRPELVDGKRVLEMGSGCALVGITSAHMARYTLMTDHDEEVVTNVQCNLRLNAQSWLARDGEPQREVATCRLDWDDVPAFGWPERDRFDTILAAEVIYGNWGDKVARAMVEMLAQGGTMMMSVSEDRRGSIGAFKEQLFMSGFKVLETKILAPAGTVRIYECTKRLGDEDRITFVERDDSAQESPWRSKPSSEISVDSATRQASSVSTRPMQPPPPPPISLGSRNASSFTPSIASKAQPRRKWMVVGGREKGIIVRDGCDGVKSAYIGRLDHGALVEEIQRMDKRIEYRLYKGTGPPSGWVTLVSAKGAKLLVEYEGK